MHRRSRQLGGRPAAAQGPFAGVHSASTSDLVLSVYGLACRLFDSGPLAAAMASGEQLMPCHGDADLLVDRYDVRLLLDNLAAASVRPGVQHAVADAADAEELEYERYRDLDESGGRGIVDPADAAELVPEVYVHPQAGLEGQAEAALSSLPPLGRLGAAGDSYAAVSLTYDMPSEAEAGMPASPRQAEAAEAQRAQQPPALSAAASAPFTARFTVPESLQDHLPETERMHKIIAQTANYVRESAQIEFVLRVKQANNPNFGFLLPGDRLHPYFRWMVKENPQEEAGAAGAAQSVEDGPGAGLTINTRSSGGMNGLSLLSMYDNTETPRTPSTMRSQDSVEAAGDAALAATPATDPAVAGVAEGDTVAALRSEASSSEQPSTVSVEPRASAAPIEAQADTDIAAVGADVADALQDAQQIAQASAAAAAPVQPRGKHQPGTAADEGAPNQATERAQARVLPAPEMQAIIQKLVKFIQKNGIKFEAVVRQREQANPRFGFLLPQHESHWYYRQQLVEALGQEKAEALSALRCNADSTTAHLTSPASQSTADQPQQQQQPAAAGKDAQPPQQEAQAQLLEAPVSTAEPAAAAQTGEEKPADGASQPDPAPAQPKRRPWLTADTVAPAQGAGADGSGPAAKQGGKAGASGVAIRANPSLLNKVMQRWESTASKPANFEKMIGPALPGITERPLESLEAIAAAKAAKRRRRARRDSLGGGSASGSSESEPDQGQDQEPDQQRDGDDAEAPAIAPEEAAALAAEEEKKAQRRRLARELLAARQKQAEQAQQAEQEEKLAAITRHRQAFLQQEDNEDSPPLHTASSTATAAAGGSELSQAAALRERLLLKRQRSEGRVQAADLVDLSGQPAKQRRLATEPKQDAATIAEHRRALLAMSQEDDPHYDSEPEPGEIRPAPVGPPVPSLPSLQSLIESLPVQQQHHSVFEGAQAQPLSGAAAAAGGGGADAADEQRQSGSRGIGANVSDDGGSSSSDSRESEASERVSRHKHHRHKHRHRAETSSRHRSKHQERGSPADARDSSHRSDRSRSHTRHTTSTKLHSDKTHRTRSQSRSTRHVKSARKALKHARSRVIDHDAQQSISDGSDASSSSEKDKRRHRKASRHTAEQANERKAARKHARRAASDESGSGNSSDDHEQRQRHASKTKSKRREHRSSKRSRKLSDNDVSGWDEAKHMGQRSAVVPEEAKPVLPAVEVSSDLRAKIRAMLQAGS